MMESLPEEGRKCVAHLLKLVELNYRPNGLTSLSQGATEQKERQTRFLLGKERDSRTASFSSGSSSLFVSINVACKRFKSSFKRI